MATRQTMVKKRHRQLLGSAKRYARAKYSEEGKRQMAIDAFIDGARWADAHRDNDIPIRITNREPRKGQSFIGAVYSSNGGYELEYCYRDDWDGSYHDIVSELNTELLVARLKSMPADMAPQWVHNFKEEGMKMRNRPDYWWPLPPGKLVDSLTVYGGSPTARQMKKDMEDFKSSEILREIEDEMNS